MDDLKVYRKLRKKMLSNEKKKKPALKFNFEQLRANQPLSNWALIGKLRMTRMTKVMR